MWPFASRQNGSDIEPSSMPDSPVPGTASGLLPPPQAIGTLTPSAHASNVKDDAESEFHYTSYPHERLGMPILVRLPLLCVGSLITGFGLGATTGGRKAADRFRAENSHRFPTTQAGWYLYHRSKSYNTTVGAAKEGMRFGSGLVVWAAVFGVVEEAMDRLRARLFMRDEEDRANRQRDFLNTLVAGMSTVGAYVIVKRMDVYAAGKMARMAFKWSLAYGLAQDGLGCLKGERPGYVQWMMESTRRRVEASEY